MQYNYIDDSTAIQGAGLWVVIALGVLVAVLVLLLILSTGAWLYSRNKIAALKRFKHSHFIHIS